MQKTEALPQRDSIHGIHVGSARLHPRARIRKQSKDGGLPSREEFLRGHVPMFDDVGTRVLNEQDDLRNRPPGGWSQAGWSAKV